MKKVSVTYHAGKGETKVVEAWGCTFYDGKAEEVTVSDEYYNEMVGNRFFELGKPSDVSAADAEKEKQKAVNAADKAAEKAAEKSQHPAR